MTKLGFAVALVLLGGCGKSSDKSGYDKPMEAPSLSAAGDVKVPPGHETTFTFGTEATKLEYTWVSIINFQGKPAIQLMAQGGPKHGTFSWIALIPDHTPTLASLAGSTVGAAPDSVTFGNTPTMASGTGATIRITEVTPTYMAGTFEAQACGHGERTCTLPTQVKNGTFKAFRSALSDDATFARYTKQ